MGTNPKDIVFSSGNKYRGYRNETQEIFSVGLYCTNCCTILLGCTVPFLLPTNQGGRTGCMDLLGTQIEEGFCGGGHTCHTAIWACKSRYYTFFEVLVQSLNATVN